jgi:hypothetical protein
MRTPHNRPVRVRDHRFVAKYVDDLWHTDLHQIHFPDEPTGGIRIISLLGFLDDASRFVMHHWLLPEKKSGYMRCVRVRDVPDVGRSMRPRK